MQTHSERHTATLIHLSTLTQYMFPFGSFIFPLLLWSLKRDSNFVSRHGKAALNFQLSILMYSIIIVFSVLISAGIFAFHAVSWNFSIENLSFDMNDIQNLGAFGVVSVSAVLLIILLKTIEFILIIIASVASLEGRDFKYPLTINFIKNSVFKVDNELHPTTNSSSINQP